MDAIHHIIQHHLFNPSNFEVRTSCKTITVAENQRYANQLFCTARQILTRNRVMRHDVHRELTLREKAILGDLKLLLGYRHVIPPQQPPQLFNLDSDDEDQSPPAPQPPPRPPPNNLDHALIILAQNNRSAIGNHAVSWQEARSA